MTTIREESSNVAKSPVTDPCDLERLPVHSEISVDIAHARTHAGGSRQHREYRLLGAQC
jgi:hypothetical protein